MSHRTSPSPSALGTVLEFDRIRITTRAKFTFNTDMPDLKVRGYGPKDPIEIYKESRWNPDFNSTLESLFEKDVIEDKRFTLNGIKIKRSSPNG